MRHRERSTSVAANVVAIKRANCLILMVGAAGLEPATLCLEGRCSIQLSYAPTMLTSLFSISVWQLSIDHFVTFLARYAQTMPILHCLCFFGKLLRMLCLFLNQL